MKKMKLFLQVNGMYADNIGRDMYAVLQFKLPVLGFNEAYINNTTKINKDSDLIHGGFVDAWKLEVIEGKLLISL